MKTIISIIILVFLFVGCQKSAKEITGIYVKSPTVNVIDSLFIYSDTLQFTQVYNRSVYKYKQVLYNKKTGELLFINNGTWWLNEGRIEFMDFFFDNDNNRSDHSYSKEAIRNAVTLFSSSFDGDDIIAEKGIYYVKVE